MKRSWWQTFSGSLRRILHTRCLPKLDTWQRYVVYAAFVWNTLAMLILPGLLNRHSVTAFGTVIFSTLLPGLGVAMLVRLLPPMPTLRGFCFVYLMYFGNVGCVYLLVYLAGRVVQKSREQRQRASKSSRSAP